MTDNTRQMIRCAINSDATMTEEERQALESICNGSGLPRLTSDQPLEPVLTRGEVANLLRISVKGVDWWARKGKLKRVSLGGSRSLGFSRDSVRAVLEARK